MYSWLDIKRLVWGRITMTPIAKNHRDDQHRKQVENIVTEFREKSLDLTLRNSLLRLPDTTSSLRVINIPTESVAQLLVEVHENGRGLRLSPCDAEPREIALAKKSFQEKSGVVRLVTTQGAAKLSAIVAGLRKQNERLIQERGTPCSFLTAYVLKWTAEDGTVCNAPLFLIPIDLDDELDLVLRTRSVSFSPSQRETIVNPVLLAMLKSKFSMEFTNFDDYEFESIAGMRKWIRDTADAWARHKGWTIEEHAVIGIFDCGAIPADCDTSMWPEGIGTSTALQQVILASSSPIASETTPAFLPNDLLLEADGSQLRALQMAARGSHLVIHGPPGSGKSQTIVNLISQILGQGKTVLFVAQKPEAAMVVHRRLKSVGIAPFCTLLTSSSTASGLKASVIEGLSARLKLRKTQTDANQKARIRLDRSVELLDKTALALGRAMPQFGQIARELIAELAILRQRKAKKLPLTHIVEPTTLRQFEDAIHALASLADQRNAVPDSAFERLAGIGSSEKGEDPNEASGRLRGLVIDAKSGLADVQAALDLLAAINYPVPHGDPQQLRKWLAEAPELAPTSDPELVQIATRLHRPGASEALGRLIRRKQRQREILQRQPDAKQRSTSLIESERATWPDVAARLQGKPVDTKTIDEASSFRDTLHTFVKSIDDLISTGPRTAALDAITEAPDVSTWQIRMSLISRIAPADADIALLTQCFPVTEPKATQVVELGHALESLQEYKRRAEELTFVDRMPQLTELQECVVTMRTHAGFFGNILGTVVSKDYRRLKRTLRRMISGDARRKSWGGAMTAALAYRTAQQQFEDLLRRYRANIAQDFSALQLLKASQLLEEIHAIAQSGLVPDGQLWRILRQSIHPDLAHKHRELYQCALRLNRETDVVQTVLQVNGATEVFSFARARKLLSMHIQSVDMALSQAANWKVQGTATINDVVTNAEAASAILKLQQECTHDSDLRALLADASHGLESDEIRIERAQSWYASAAAGKNQHWNDRICKILSDAATSQVNIDSHRSCLTKMRAGLDALLQSIDQINATFEFAEPANQYRPTGDKSTSTLTDNLACLQENLAHLTDLFSFRSSARKAEQLAGIGIIARLLNGELAMKDVVDSYKVTAYERAMRQSEALLPLSEFDRKVIDKAIDQLPELDSEIRKLNASMLVDKVRTRDIPQGTTFGLVREKSEMGLISHIVGTPGTRITIQEIWRRARNALAQLQPCTIATPTTVSEVLPRIIGMFDVVIIDEASQVEPASALGAIARGQQTIVVGDQQQLPPTNFFTSSSAATTEVADDSGDPADTDAVSILDKAVATLPEVLLSGHYRSRHHSLINFSNIHFYKSQLVVAPSRTPRSDKYGIISHHIKDATFAAGENEIEAIAIAKHAMDQLRRNPDESLGIVAFNVKQAALIETHLEALANKSQDAFRAYARSKQLEFPLFIRSLESVQGDERDVMLIS